MRNTLSLPEILSKNLRFFMKAEGCLYPNANALGKAADVAANTVRNMLDPEKRTVTAEKPLGYPTLDNLEKIAKKLNLEVWELLHPDIEQSIRERKMYQSIQADYAKIAKNGSPAKSTKLEIQ